MHSRLTLLLAAIALLLAVPTAHAQDRKEENTSNTLAKHYLTFTGQMQVAAGNQHDKDISVFVGWMMPRGDKGRWMPRLEAGAGLSLYSPDARNFGYLAGAQAGVVRALTGDYLELGEGMPLEFLVGVGGGAFAGWSLEHAVDETVFVPTVHASLGLRNRPRQSSSTLVLLELMAEESIGDRPSRFHIRISVGWPR